MYYLISLSWVLYSPWYKNVIYTIKTKIFEEKKLLKFESLEKKVFFYKKFKQFFFGTATFFLLHFFSLPIVWVDFAHNFLYNLGIM